MLAAASFRTAASTPPAVLGKDVSEMWNHEPFIIEGEVEGTIEVAEHLTCAPNRNIRASVKAKQIDVLGSVRGNVEVAEKVYIRDSTQFVDEIHALDFVIEAGEFVCGKANVSSSPAGVPDRSRSTAC